MASQTSPDRRHAAVLFERSCGATTSFATQLSVLRAGAPLTGAGNVFVADANHGAAVAGAWGGPWAAVRWLSSGELAVDYADGARVFKQVAEQDGVRIRYERRRP